MTTRRTSVQRSEKAPAPGGTLAGKILVGRMPNDPFFSKSEVLILKHDMKHGALGVVLNKPGPAGTFLGGPITSGSLIIHKRTDWKGGSDEIVPGLFIAANGIEDRLRADAKKAGVEWNEYFASILRKRDDTKAFISHSAWSPGQLDAEMKAGAWLVTRQATLNDVFPSKNAVVAGFDRVMLN
jgi:putative AlgH/UPF0301 family transcriptional regulator